MLFNANLLAGARTPAYFTVRNPYAARSGSLLWIDSDWPDEMRSDLRFQELVRRIGLPR